MALSRTDTILGSDMLVVYKYNDSDYRAAPISAVLDYLQSNLSFPEAYVTQYSSPSATGFTVTISEITADTHLILTPVAGYAAGTITLPLASTCVDGQKLMVNCTQSVTTLTISANGASAVTGAPATLAANAYFTLKFDLPTLTWYRVG